MFRCREKTEPSHWLDDEPREATGTLGPTLWYKAHRTADSHLHEVWLDSIPQPLCVEARADQGWADCYLTDAGGAVVRLLGLPQIHRYYGEVVIRRLATIAELRGLRRPSLG